jgi:hypothetical protein
MAARILVVDDEPKYILTEPWVGYRFAENERLDAPRTSSV